MTNGSGTGVAAEETTLTRAWFATAILGAVYVASFVDRAIMNLLVGSIRRDLGISDTGMSMLIGPAFAVLYLGMSIPLGMLADRWRRTYLIAAACTLWSLATTASAFADGYWSLFACRVLVGFGEAALIPASYSLLADSFPRHRLAGALSAFSAGAWVGTGAALVVGGAVMHTLGTTEAIHVPFVGTRADWQLAFLIVGPPGVLLAALVLLVREPARSGFAAPRPTTAASHGGGVTLQFARANLPFLLRFLFGFGMFSIMAQGTIAWAPMALVRAHGLDPGTVGLRLGTLYLTCSVGGIVAAGWIADRMYRRGRRDAALLVGASGIAALALSVAAFGLAPSAEWALTAAIALTFFVSFPLGVAATALQLATPARMRGQLSALYLLVTGGLGMGLGPTLVALLTDFAFGSDAAVGAALAVTALACGALGTVLLLSARRAFVRLASE